MDAEMNLKRKAEELEEPKTEANETVDLNGSSKKLKSDSNDQSNDQSIDESNGQSNEEPINESNEQPTADTPSKIGLYSNSNLSLSLINLKKIIDIRYNEKSAILEGEYDDQRVLIFIEKLPFEEDALRKLFDEPSFELTKILQNDIYGSYSLEPTIVNKMKTTIICPATDKHFEKYLRSQYVMIEETASRYEQITLPYLEENKFSIEWVYNILDHKQESERILFEDEDDENGFILLPDLKWDGKMAKKLYLVAIVRRRDVKSIRDLTGDHLAMLRNLKEKSCKIIKEKYDIDSDKLQIYFHYQPSYYHLHIHFNPIHYEHPRLFIGSSHLLDTVISNLEIDSNYYKKATLTFRIKASNSLNDYYKKKLETLEC